MRAINWLTDPVIDWLAMCAVIAGAGVPAILDAMARM